MRGFGSLLLLKLNPKELPLSGRATARFASFTLSRSHSSSLAAPLLGCGHRQPHTLPSPAYAVRARGRVRRVRCSIAAGTVVHLGVSLLPPGLTSPFSSTHFQECPNQSDHSLVGYSPCDRRQQLVVIDPIKEF